MAGGCYTVVTLLLHWISWCDTVVTKGNGLYVIGVFPKPVSSQSAMQANDPKVAAQQRFLGFCRNGGQEAGGLGFKSDPKPSAGGEADLIVTCMLVACFA